MKNTLNQNGGRIYSADLVKIIAMFFVLILHLIGVGGVFDGANGNTLLQGILSGMEGVAFVSVNLFALATGFIYEGRSVKYSRLFELWLRAVFISLACLAVVYFVGGKITQKIILKSVFVFSKRTFWYLNEYIEMMLISPALNAAVRKMNAKETGFVLLVFAAVFSLFPTATANDTLSRGYSFLWLSFLYAVGAYIKKYNLHQRLSKWFFAVIYILSTAAQSILIYVSKNREMTFFETDYSHVHAFYNNAFVLTSAVSLFILILGVEFKSQKSKKIIVSVSSVSFAVYLVHGCPAIWQYILRQLEFIGKMNTAAAAFTVLGLSLGIYICAIIIGFAQARLFKAVKINILCEKIEILIRKIFNILFGLGKKLLIKNDR